MALRLPSVCPDGVVYIRAAQSIEAGNLRLGFTNMSLNVYPLILLLLHRTGLDWEPAAAVWGVVISSLVVLPLWGWVRRQFDDGVALAACLLYAVHPKMIEWSPEAMRDPTFWFLFMLAIYWLWRAITGVSYRYFLAAGAAVTLASLTRTEGLFLLIPLGLWTFWRFLALRTGRRKLLLGGALCLAVFPALVALVNVGWVCGHTGWTALRTAPLLRAQPWIQHVMGYAPAETDGDAVEGSLTAGRMMWVFFPTMTRGLSPIFALLMFGGIWGWRKVWFRRDHQPLFLTAMVVVLGIWIQLWYDKIICPRYALPIVLMGAPFAALGGLGLAARLLRVGQRVGNWGQGPFVPSTGRRPRAGRAVPANGAGPHFRSQAMVVAAAVLAGAVCITDAMTSNSRYFEVRRAAARLGQWLAGRLEPSMVVGPTDITPIVGYYAHRKPLVSAASNFGTFAWGATDAAILSLVASQRAEVVVLRPEKQLTSARCASLRKKMLRSGLGPLNGEIPAEIRSDLEVLVRNGADSHGPHGNGRTERLTVGSKVAPSPPLLVSPALR